MTAEVPTTDAVAWRMVWEDALREVEVDVEAAEELLRQLHEVPTEGADTPRDTLNDWDPWMPRALPGPFPAEFADRARSIVERQLQVSERLAAALVQNRHQRRALTKLDAAERPPVFVDRAI